MDLEELSDVPEEPVPEATGLFDNFVTADFDVIIFDYSVGTLLSSSLSSRVQVIGVCEIDQQALIAVPDLAWHRLKTKRELPEDALLRATRVEVVSASVQTWTEPLLPRLLRRYGWAFSNQSWWMLSCLEGPNWKLAKLVSRSMHWGCQLFHLPKPFAQ